MTAYMTCMTAYIAHKRLNQSLNLFIATRIFRYFLFYKINLTSLIIVDPGNISLVKLGSGNIT